MKNANVFLWPITFLALACSDHESLPETEAPEVPDGVDGDGEPEEELASAPEEGLALAEEPENDVLFEETVEVPPLTSPTLANGSPVIVYVNFGGPVIRSCGGNYCNDSATNHSSLIGSTFGRSAIDFRAYTSTTGRTTILRALRAYFAKYNVSFTTSRPKAPPYTMLVISPSLVGPTGRRGTSFLDCSNATRSDIAIVYRIGSTGPSKIAHYAAHEIGHTLGLMHVKSSTDLMQYASSGSVWTTSTLDTSRNPAGYTCFPGSSVQNAPATLTKNVGLRP